MAVVATLPQNEVLVVGRRTLAIRTIVDHLDRLRAEGRAHLLPPWPGPDKPFGSGGWVWSPYSPERLLERTRLVFDGAIRGYIQVVETWLAPLAKQLTTYAVLPARLRGTLTVGPGDDYAGGPVLAWWFEAAATGQMSSVDINLVPREAAVFLDDAAARTEYQRLLAQRPEARGWLSFTRHHQALDIFGADPATELAFAWIAKDLKRIRLAN